MKTLTINEASVEFKTTFANVIDNNEPTLITHQRMGNVVLMPQENYESMVETLYLLSTSANAKRLNKSVDNIRASNFKIVDLFQSQ
jgi:antitoxin YefM